MLPDIQKGEAALSRPLSPSVRHLTAVLEERILSGYYANGARLPPERALSEEFSLSRPTIRQALAELETRHLLQRLAGHRPIVWNGSSAPSIPVSARNIGLWISGNPGDPGPMAVTRSIYRYLPPDDYRLVIACPPEDSREQSVRAETETLYRLSEDADVAGLILWHLGGPTNREALEVFRASGKPLVFVDRQPPSGFDADFVGVHNELAAADVVRHLISRGHRRIVHITNADHASSVAERLKGYRLALREAGIPFREEFVLNSDFRDGADKSAWDQAVALFGRESERPTGAFAVNDYSAFSLITALREGGLRIPEDVAVVGFDDSERYFHTPAFITTVSQPFEQIGTAAVQLLLERLEEPATNTYRHILLSTRLVERTSSALRCTAEI